MKACEGRMVGYGKDSKTCRIKESGTKIVESINVTFIGTLPVKLNTLDHDPNGSESDTFLDLESSSVLRGAQGMPGTEPDAELDAGGSHGGSVVSDSDEESDSDVDSLP